MMPAAIVPAAQTTYRSAKAVYAKRSDIGKIVWILIALLLGLLAVSAVLKMLGSSIFKLGSKAVTKVTNQDARVLKSATPKFPDGETVKWGDLIAGPLHWTKHLKKKS